VRYHENSCPHVLLTRCSWRQQCLQQQQQQHARKRQWPQPSVCGHLSATNMYLAVTSSMRRHAVRSKVSCSLVPARDSGATFRARVRCSRPLAGAVTACVQRHDSCALYQRPWPSIQSSNTLCCSPATCVPCP
jgi:hypothetical protein